jgi:plastocyanin
MPVPHPKLLAAGVLAAVLAGFVAVAAPGAPDVDVAISGFAFAQPKLTVPVGTRVVWVNRDDIPHTVTSAGSPRLFGSPALDTGEQFSRLFDRAGIYRYFCAIHPHMQGTVIVK